MTLIHLDNLRFMADHWFLTGNRVIGNQTSRL